MRASSSQELVFLVCVKTERCCRNTGSKSARQLQHHDKYVSQVLPGYFHIACWQLVRCNSKVRLASRSFPHHHCHRRLIPIVFHTSFTCTRALPKVFSKCFTPCRTSVLPECFQCQIVFPCRSQVLHTVLTNLCTCQSVVPTLCLPCHLTLRVPQLLGGGGGGVSGGGSEGFTVSFAQPALPRTRSALRSAKSNLHRNMLLLSIVSYEMGC